MNMGVDALTDKTYFVAASHPVPHMIRVLIVEDNADFSESMVELLGSADGITVAGVLASGKNIVKNVSFHQPDVVLMDIDMPVENGLQSLRTLRAAGSEVCVLMLTVFDDNERVFQAICHGASGYLLKRTSPEKLVEAIREAHGGGAPMTPSVARQVLKLFQQPFQKSEDLETLTAREHDVLSLLVRGYSYKMAADELKVGIETLRFHIKNIYAKLHVNSKSEAVAKAIHNRIV